MVRISNEGRRAPATDVALVGGGAPCVRARVPGGGTHSTLCRSCSAEAMAPEEASYGMAAVVKPAKLRRNVAPSRLAEGVYTRQCAVEMR